MNSRPSRSSIEEVYRQYASNGVLQQKWDRDQPGNRAIESERDSHLVRSLVNVVGPATSSRTLKVLDLGCGGGVPLGRVSSGLVGAGHVVESVGVELLVERLADAKEGANYATSDGRALGLASGSIDVVMTWTVFSSIPDLASRMAVAREIERVLVPGGALCWYDLRVPSPTNPNVAPIAERSLRSLFPRFAGSLDSVTLLPPLARRLGARPERAYRLLRRLPLLRTHLAGVLTAPAQSPQPGAVARLS